MSFDQWMIIVDHLLRERFGGMDSGDLPDWCWWDLWDSELTPREAVADYLEGEGFFA